LAEEWNLCPAVARMIEAPNYLLKAIFEILVKVMWAKAVGVVVVGEQIWEK
jgi:hypothetical protein